MEMPRRRVRKWTSERRIPPVRFSDAPGAGQVNDRASRQPPRSFQTLQKSRFLPNPKSKRALPWGCPGAQAGLAGISPWLGRDPPALMRVPC